MRLRLLAKDPTSADKGCPSLHEDLDCDEFVIQGQLVDPDQLPNVLPGEGGIRIKREIVIDAVRRYGAL